MKRIASPDRIGDDMIAHVRRHRGEAFGQGMVQGQWVAVGLPHEFGKKPVKQCIPFGRAGRAPAICRDDTVAVEFQRGGAGQTSARPELGKQQRVAGCHAPLPARQIEGLFHGINQGLTARLAILAGHAGSLKSSAKQVCVLRGRLCDRAKPRDDLASKGRALQHGKGGALQHLTTRPEPVLACGGKSGQSVIDPTSCHLSPARLPIFAANLAIHGRLVRRFRQERSVTKRKQRGRCSPR